MAFRFLSKLFPLGNVRLPVFKNGIQQRQRWTFIEGDERRSVIIKNKSDGVHFKLLDAAVVHVFALDGSGEPRAKRDKSYSIALAFGMEVKLLLEAEQNYGLNVRLQLREYDNQGCYLDAVEFASGRVGVYRPSAGAAHAMVCMYMQGEGWLRVKALHMNIITPETDQSKLPVLAGKADASGAATLLYKTLCDTADSVSCLPLRSMERQGLARQSRATLHAPLNLRVAIITDIYMFNFYKDCFAELYYLSPDNYEEVMTEHALDAVMYVTCWAGLENDEWRGIMDRARPKEAADAILEKARAACIPTIFQSIEDPSNFEHFLPFASKFDHIFTSDADMVEAYKAAVGHSRVYYGEYGVNPLFNNPVGSQPAPLRAAFFAGSYPSRYTERCADMQMVFDSLIKSDCDLVIADRNYGSSIENVAFPERYEGHLVDKFDHTQLQAVHKLFRYNINFNSIQDSPTMCAMRVYELQAQGTNMLSNYARALCCRFPGIRLLAHASGQLERLFAASDDWYDYKVRMQMVRAMMTERTGVDTVRRMALQAGLISPDAARQSAAHYQPTVFAVSTAPEHAQHMLDAQSYTSWVLTSPEAVASDIAAHAGGPVCLTFLHADWDYEAHYLQDMVNALKYTEARYVTKDGWFDGTAYQPGREHAYVSAFPSKCRTLFYLDACKEGTLDALLALDTEAGLYAPGGYSIDPFELNVERTLKSKACMHEGSPKNTSEDTPERGFKLSLIVPVHSDTQALEQRLIPSVRLNKAWPEIELLLAPVDGAQAGLKQAVERLNAYFSNVRLAGYGGEPASAQGAIRAAALEAKGQFVSVILSHNDTAPAAYDMLLDCAEHSIREMGGVDIVSGYEVRVKAAKTAEACKPSGSGITLWQREQDATSQPNGSEHLALGSLAAQATLVERSHLLAALAADTRSAQKAEAGAFYIQDTYCREHVWADYNAASALIALCAETAQKVARTPHAWAVDYADYMPDKNYHGAR